MATRTVKARVELDGEKEYKAALSELNKGNQVLASEMRKLQAQYQDNANSTEALTAKGELLERQLLQQKDKVQTLREALANATKEYGEADRRTQEWQIQLNNAETAQINLEHAIKENNEALKIQTKDLVGLGDAAEKIAKPLGIKVPEAAKKGLNGIGSFSKTSVAAFAAVTAGVTALIKTLESLYEITIEAAADVDMLLTESMTSGLSTETLQKWQYSEELIDVSYSTISATLTKLTANMAKARDGSEGLADAFAQLGVSVTDAATGELLPAEDVFYDLIDALGNVENATERDALTMQILGKSAQDLNPLILQGSNALRELGIEAEATGYILDESQIKKLAEVDDAYQRLQLQIESVKKELAAEFAPAAEVALKEFTSLVKEAGAALTESGLIKGVSELVQYSLAIIEPFLQILDLTPLLVNEFQPLYTILHSIAGAFAWIADVANAAIGALTGFTAAGRTRFNTALGLNAQYGMYSNMQKWDGTAQAYESWRNSSYSGAYNANYGYDPATGRYYDRKTGNYIYGYNASGNDNWRGGLTYLGEAGAELAVLPSGTRILSAQDTRLSDFGTTIWNVTIDAKNVKEFNDIVMLAQNARVISRMKG